MICQRCTKNVSPEGIHTCTPTDGWRALEQDAMRYRWLRANWTLLRSMATRTTLKFGFEANAWADFGEPVIDAAIDSAMGEKP